MINEPERDKFTQKFIFECCWWYQGISVTGRNLKGSRWLLEKDYVGQVPSLLQVPGGLKFRLGLCPGDKSGKSAFPNFMWGLGITAVFTLSLFQTWMTELCCSVALFHVLSAQTQFFVYTGNFLGLKQQTLEDTQIWKKRPAKELWQNGAEDAITQAVRKIVSVNYMILVFSGDEGKRINDLTYSPSST